MTAKEPMPILSDDIREASASQSEMASREAVGDHGTNPAIPLAIDLDGTLLATDLLAESLFMLAKTRPLKLVQTLFSLLRGLAAFKERIAMEAIPDVETLPYDRTVLAYLDEQKRQGRHLVLATGADQAVARKVAQQLDRFDTVLASDGRVNLRGQAKRDRLVAEFGVGGFDCVGTRNSDRTVWHAGRNTILVHPSERLRKAKEKGATVERVFERDGNRVEVYARAFRVKHWLKNLLVFLPLIAEHHFFELASLAHAFLAFVAFCLCASGLYLLNDLFDLPEDRRHPHKRQRVLASGQLRLGSALMLVPLLLLGAGAVAWTLPSPFLAVLGVYLALMLAYNLRFRDIPVADVATLGAGYALRVIGGAAATNLGVSPWLIGASFLFFTGLALLKRYADLVVMRSHYGDGARVHGYFSRDAPWLAVFGRASSYSALLLLGYHSAFVGNLHGRHELIWVVLVLLSLWLTHMWYMAARGRIIDDPVVFALTDRESQIVGGLAVIALLAAT